MKPFIIGSLVAAKAMANDLGFADGEWHHVGKPSSLPRCRFSEKTLFVTHDWQSLPSAKEIYCCVCNMAEKEVMEKAGMEWERA